MKQSNEPPKEAKDTMSGASALGVEYASKTLYSLYLTWVKEGRPRRK